MSVRVLTEQVLTSVHDLINRYSRLSIHEHVIVEAILDGGSVAEAAPVEALHGLPQDVGTGVPVHLQTRAERTRSDQTRPGVSPAAHDCMYSLIHMLSYITAAAARR